MAGAVIVPRYFSGSTRKWAILGTVNNSAPRIIDGIEVDLSVFDRNGRKMGTATAIVPRVNAKATCSFVADADTDTPASFRLARIFSIKEHSL